MKRINLALFAIVLLISGCELLDELGITVNPEKTEFEFVIKVNPAGSYNYTEEILGENLDSVAKAEGYDIDKVNEAKLKGCEIMIVAPEGANFDAFESFSVTVSATTEEAGLVIASVSDIPNGVTELTFETTEDDLKGYLMDDTYKLYVSGVQDGEVTEEISVQGIVEYSVKIGF